MNLDTLKEITLDDIPRENRKTKEPNPLFELAQYIDECSERGASVTGAQVIAKLSDLVGGERIDVPHVSTLARNISLRLFPVS